MSFVRIYKDQAKALLTTLIYLRQNGMEFADALSRAYNDGRPNTVDAAMWEVIIRGPARGDGNSYRLPSLNEVIEVLWSQITGDVDGQKQHAGDKRLIDQLVEVLQMPRSRNILSGKALDSMRKALLIPSEMAGLNSRLEHRELHCVGCGRTMENGEMMTLRQEGQHDWSTYCAACFQPTVVKYSGDGRTVPIPQSIQRKINIVINTNPDQAAPADGDAAEQPRTRATGTRVSVGGSLRNRADDIMRQARENAARIVQQGGPAGPAGQPGVAVDAAPGATDQNVGLQDVIASIQANAQQDAQRRRG